MLLLPSPHDVHARARQRVLGLLRVHGWNATSFQVLERGFSYWFDPEADACVAYVDTGSAHVAAGAPIAAEDDLARSAGRFARAARAARRRACFVAVEDRFVRAEHAHVASTLIGEQPSWDPAAWQGIVGQSRQLREQLRRARAKGVRVRAVAPEELATDHGRLRAQIEDLIAGWLATRRVAPMGFLVDVQPFDFAHERRAFVAERNGRVVGLLVAVPVYGRRGWFFEDLLRAEDAPNGTTELLVDAGMRAIGGATDPGAYVTLGLAPLSGRIDPWLRLVRTYGAPVYDFEGVHRFKAKLRPHAWSPIHLAWPNGDSGMMALYDALAAFTMRPRDGHDCASFLRFGAETLARSWRTTAARLSLGQRALPPIRWPSGSERRAR